ncbi:cytochrome P450 [Jatrophihabitans sp. GAS493]|uniref:cytochrome P450 n=1 Tax=Jatrophihabitans sp. GAS493 TaxID=1907575 RepID=UPI000BB7DC2A|nr:cytochrome P450 [Jatrophihabitans sp. GAS493]SOD72780.1 cytochrome P450 [Jatrophihabitans sp. GAS493]
MTAGEVTVGEPSLPNGPPLPVLLQSFLFGKYRHRYIPLLRRRYGDIFTIRMAPHNRTIVQLTRPEDIKRVFTGSPDVFHAGEGNAVLEPIMGNRSVLLLDGGEHMRVRQLLMPAFNGAALRGYGNMIAEITRAQVATWPVGSAFAVQKYTQRLTLEIILQVVFGVTDEQRLAELRPVVAGVVDLNIVTMIGWYYKPLRRVWPWRRFAQLRSRLDELIYAEIAERRLATDLGRRTDVLSTLLSVSPQESLTDAELRDNLITLLLAGHETTATALAWALHDLARNDAVQRRAQQAADEGDTHYLEAVAKEAMRLHPVIYEVVRKLKQPVEIGGHLLAAGVSVMPGVGVVQSDPANFPHPEEFDPTRFIDSQPAANTWIPFGGGVRRCIGAGFSLVEAAAVLQEVLGRFDVVAERQRPEPAASRNITLAPSRGSRIVLKRR